MHTCLCMRTEHMLYLLLLLDSVLRQKDINKHSRDKKVPRAVCIFVKGDEWELERSCSCKVTARSFSWRCSCEQFLPVQGPALWRKASIEIALAGCCTEMSFNNAPTSTRSSSRSSAWRALPTSLALSSALTGASWRVIGEDASVRKGSLDSVVKSVSHASLLPCPRARTHVCMRYIYSRMSRVYADIFLQKASGVEEPTLHREAYLRHHYIQTDIRIMSIASGKYQRALAGG